MSGYATRHSPEAQNTLTQKEVQHQPESITIEAAIAEIREIEGRFGHAPEVLEQTHTLREKLLQLQADGVKSTSEALGVILKSLNRPDTTSSMKVFSEVLAANEPDLTQAA